MLNIALLLGNTVLIRLVQISRYFKSFLNLRHLKNFNFFDFFTRNFQYFAFLQNFLSILMFCRERERKKALIKFHHISTSNISKCYSVITLCTFIFLQKWMKWFTLNDICMFRCKSSHTGTFLEDHDIVTLSVCLFSWP